MHNDNTSVFIVVYLKNSCRSSDDLMRNQLVRLEVVRKLPGVPTTASTPINYLSADFAALFDPSLDGEPLNAVIGAWRARHLSQATQQRMALRAQGIQAKLGDVLIEMPDDTRIRVAAALSAQIAKGLIEEFSKHHRARRGRGRLLQ